MPMGLSTGLHPFSISPSTTFSFPFSHLSFLLIDRLPSPACQGHQVSGDYMYMQRNWPTGAPELHGRTWRKRRNNFPLNMRDGRNRVVLRMRETLAFRNLYPAKFGSWDCNTKPHIMPTDQMPHLDLYTAHSLHGLAPITHPQHQHLYPMPRGGGVTGQVSGARDVYQSSSTKEVVELVSWIPYLSLKSCNIIE